MAIFFFLASLLCMFLFHLEWRMGFIGVHMGAYAVFSLQVLVTFFLLCIFFLDLAGAP